MSAIEFAKEMCRHGFDGSDLSGAEIMEVAERHGLLVAVAYDPEKHPDVTGSEYLEPGDRIYIFTEAFADKWTAPEMLAAVVFALAETMKYLEGSDPMLMSGGVRNIDLREKIKTILFTDATGGVA